MQMSTLLKPDSEKKIESKTFQRELLTMKITQIFIIFLQIKLSIFKLRYLEIAWGTYCEENFQNKREYA